MIINKATLTNKAFSVVYGTIELSANDLVGNFNDLSIYNSYSEVPSKHKTSNVELPVVLIKREKEHNNFCLFQEDFDKFMASVDAYKRKKNTTIKRETYIYTDAEGKELRI